MVPCSIIRNPKHGELCFGCECLTIKERKDYETAIEERKDLR